MQGLQTQTCEIPKFHPNISQSMSHYDNVPVKLTLDPRNHVTDSSRSYLLKEMQLNTCNDAGLLTWKL